MLRQGIARSRRRRTVRNLVTNPAGVSTAGMMTGGNQVNSLVTFPGVAPRVTGFQTNPTGASGDTFLSIGGDSGGMRLGMRAGGTYTASGYIYVHGPQSGVNTRKRVVALFYRDSGGTYIETKSTPAPDTVGTYRVSVTVKIPVGATEAFVRFYNGANTAGELISWTALMLTEGSKLYDYIDGASYGAQWEGTPNDSKSVGYPESPQLVRNYHMDPINDLGSAIGVNASVVTKEADTRFGSASLVKIVLPTGGATDSGAAITTGVGPASKNLPYDSVVTMEFFVQTDFTGTIRVSRQGSGLSVSTQAFSVEAGVTQRIKFTTNTGGNGTGWIMYLLRGTGSTVGTIYASKFMLYLGSSYDGAHSDGSTPGWRWTGTPWRSQSVGFPYTLKSITNQDPYLENTGTEVVSRADVIGSTEDRTVFSVYDILGWTTYPTLASFANSANPSQGMMLYGFNTTANSRVFGRIQITGSTVQDVSVNATGIRSVGRHIGGVRSNGGMVSITAFATSVTNPGIFAFTTGFVSSLRHPANQLGYPASVDHVPIKSWVYRGSMPDQTRDAVVNWIANKYGLAA